jgi:hypothetical protein
MNDKEYHDAGGWPPAIRTWRQDPAAMCVSWLWRLIRWCGRSLVFLVVLIALSWCFGAICINGPFDSAQANLLLACVWGIAALGLPFLTGSKLARWGIRLLCFLVVAVPWSFIPASNDRVWMPEYAHEPHATIAGDRVTIENLRNFDYKPGGVVIERWETRTVHLGNLRGVDMVLNYWGSPYEAHPIFTFDFGPEGRVAFSIETRREQGEASTLLGTLYKNFELIYLACDERDVIRLRTNYRSDNDSFLYKLHYRPEVTRSRFLEYVHTINRLHDHPCFYNVLTANCTTSVRAQVNPVDRLPFDWRMVANGYMDEMLHDHGILVSRLPFAEFKKRSNIMQAGKAADLDPDYSGRIRAGIEGYGPAQ